MNTFVLLPLQESIVLCSACKNNLWPGYVTVLVANHGIIKCTSILTMVIRPMINYDVDKLQDCFRQELSCRLGIHYQLSTLSVLELHRVLHLPHALLLEHDTYWLPEGNQYIPMLCGGFKAVEIIQIGNVAPCWLSKMGINIMGFGVNPEPEWACNIPRGPLLHHTSFKISLVCAMNAMDQMLFCCIAVFQYIYIIRHCGGSTNAFATRCVA